MVTKKILFSALKKYRTLKRTFENDISTSERCFKEDSLNELITTEEIRLRANKPLMIQNEKGSFFVNLEGRLTANRMNLFYVSQEQIAKRWNL